MAVFKLTSVDGDQSAIVPTERALVVGRAVTSDLPVFDPTVSRKHAEVSVSGAGLHVKDLGSSNGTFVNGNRISDSPVNPGDTITFGKVAFLIATEKPPKPKAAPPPGDFGHQAPGATIIRKMPEAGIKSLEERIIAPDTEPESVGDSKEQRQATKLSLLLEISKELARQQDVEKLLEKVVDITFKVMDVDRVSILMVEEETRELVPRMSRNKLGDAAGHRHVPRSIANRCVEERLAILTDNAAADDRFKGQSIMLQSVRSAMSTPLMGSEGNVLGILYVDNMTATNSFGDEDLEFLIAFSGIAAVAIENSDLTKKMARELVVLSNFQRYFAPNLIDQISKEEGVIGLGGEKRDVVVFFSDIRGFTEMSSEMAPDEIASLLGEYFQVMTDIVFEFGGTLDKFMGDAIMALWGAPIAMDDAADRAMSAAMKMMTALEELNKKWAAEGRQEIRHGIGINYGSVFAGNIGSESRLEYTVLGDAVNVASRLCSNAGGGEILVSEYLYRSLKAPPGAEKLDLKVKGKKDEVPAYRVK